jgi:hypothetical protein
VSWIRRFGSSSLPQRLLLALLCVLVLLAQTADLAHSHDGDVSGQIECEICLQALSDDDESVPPLLELHFGNSTEILTNYVVGERFASSIQPQSRAPPVY